MRPFASRTRASVSHRARTGTAGSRTIEINPEPLLPKRR